jgi:hypothetical protein
MSWDLLRTDGHAVAISSNFHHSNYLGNNDNSSRNLIVIFGRLKHMLQKSEGRVTPHLIPKYLLIMVRCQFAHATTCAQISKVIHILLIATLSAMNELFIVYLYRLSPGPVFVKLCTIIHY